MCVLFPCKIAISTIMYDDVDQFCLSTFIDDGDDEEDDAKKDAIFFGWGGGGW